MERHIADNLTYRNVLNDLMTQRIEGYINNAAERQVLGLGDEADKELYETDYAQWKTTHWDDINNARAEMGAAVPQILSKQINNAVTNSQGSLILDGVTKTRHSQYEDLDSEELIGAIEPQNLQDIAAPSIAYNGSGLTKSEDQLNYQHTNWRVAQSNADMIAGEKIFFIID